MGNSNQINPTVQLRKCFKIDRKLPNAKVLLDTDTGNGWPFPSTVSSFTRQNIQSFRTSIQEHGTENSDTSADRIQMFKKLPFISNNGNQATIELGSLF